MILGKAVEMSQGLGFENDAEMAMDIDTERSTVISCFYFIVGFFLFL